MSTKSMTKSDTISNKEGSAEEQGRLFEEAKNLVNVEAFYMKRCLDNKKLMDALKHASNMISELRTGVLSPKTYYSLYMLAFDELGYLNSFLLEEKHGKPMQELYELVQYAGNILPRLYLLCTVGAVYIKSKEAPARDVLRDLVEMCRGVQHPTRGLFLRNYLSEVTKDKLPDLGSDYEGEGGNVTDAIEFVLCNFIEMNKLWVRMQHQGPVRDKEKRESERLELRLLVGKNLSRLSQLDGVNEENYVTLVLPRVLEQIVNCKDRIAQQYLMEILIQVFPDEFHLATLQEVLTACGQLQSGVDIKSIISSLIDRLANFSSSSPELIPEDIEIFDIFSVQVAKVISQHPNMEIESQLALQVSLINLALRCYPTRLHYINQVLGYCQTIIESDCSPAVANQVVQLLQTPLTQHDILTILKLENYSALLNALPYITRRNVSIEIVENAIKGNTPIPKSDQVGALLDLLSVLIRDPEDQPGTIDDEEFEEDQNKVSMLIHLFRSDQADEQYQIFITARKMFSEGGDRRTRFTFVPLIFNALKLAQNLGSTGNEKMAGAIQKLLSFVRESILPLQELDTLPELVLSLNLSAALCADHCQQEDVAYDFMTQAFTILEENISDTKAQKRNLNLIISTVQQMTSLGSENYDALISNSGQKAGRQLQKADQSRSLCLVANLSYTTNSESSFQFQNGAKTLDILKRALTISEKCVKKIETVQIFVEVLNRCLFFFEYGVEEITDQYISALIELISSKMSSSDFDSDDADAISVSTYLKNTLNMISQKKESGEEKYMSIQYDN